MNKDIDGVAFDLDGTLYPNYRLNLRLIPFILKEIPLLWAFGKARDVLRGKIPGKIAPVVEAAEDFYDAQARHMGAFLNKDAAFIKERTERLIYRGWVSLFRNIKLFPYVGETLGAIRSKGLKLGLLSDFPPEQKLEYLGLGGIWDAVCCSEQVGRLKPAPESFEELARVMGLKPERLLYVGNSFSYDVIGAKNAGMKTALICHPLMGPLLRKGRTPPDFIFHDYRQLGKYVLG
ncbi:phosphoglycolate phosphatase [Spirochaetia bacterium]|nr:phosphoglycolate phosphatase [Spirochaetia bacterium]